MCLFRTSVVQTIYLMKRRITKKLLLECIEKENLNSTLFKKNSKYQSNLNNDHQDDNGIEKLFDCFFLALNYSLNLH
jgi:hypothetical protein